MHRQKYKKSYTLQPITNPQELAEHMARLAHVIRMTTIQSINQEYEKIPTPLYDLYETCKQTLISDLSVFAFADMFAQTLTYGLFVVRYYHSSPEPFYDKNAPATNAFLTDLFTELTGKTMHHMSFVGFMGDLSQLLAQTDVRAVLTNFGQHTRREDPLLHFYETFLAAYDPTLRELRGVYYTPEPVISYIIRSVDYLLRTQFGCEEGLADSSQIMHTSYEDGKEQERTSPRVLLLDPACGTGAFLSALIKYIREQYRGPANKWSEYVHEHLLKRLFGFEVLLAPYAIAHLKLSMQLAALDLPEIEPQTARLYNFKPQERLNISLTNSLQETTERSETLLAHPISAKADMQRAFPIMVILGNPPYSGHSANSSWQEGDNTRIPTFIGKLLQDYYKVDGCPLAERNSKWLQDDYVKFIRFAQWQIEQAGHGILAFITNHGYLNNPTFRGMRQSLLHSFDEIYVLDLHGNGKKQETTPTGVRDENVFAIQQGVAISLFVKHTGKKALSGNAALYHAHLWGVRPEKYDWLLANDVKTTAWQRLDPLQPFYLFVPQNNDLWLEYERAQKVTDMIPINVMGFQTHRDHFAIDFDKNNLYKRIAEMRSEQLSDEEYAAKYSLTTSNWDLADARSQLRKDENWPSRLISCLYRPFDWRYCYFSAGVMDRPRRELLDHVASKANLCIGLGRQGSAVNDSVWSLLSVARVPIDANIFRRGGVNIFPLYTYEKNLFSTTLDASNKRYPNFAPSFIKSLSSILKLEFMPDAKGDLQQTFGPEHVFHYMYAVFHSPTYRTRYADFLKIDFPRLPLTSNVTLFRELCLIGDRLIKLHLLEVPATQLPTYPAKGDNLLDCIRYIEASQGRQGRVWINKTQYFEGISPEVWNFHIGGYQVCQKWLKDRKGRTLSYSEIAHYQQIVATLSETLALMQHIDDVIDSHGGWPIL